MLFHFHCGAAIVGNEKTTNGSGAAIEAAQLVNAREGGRNVLRREGPLSSFKRCATARHVRGADRDVYRDRVFADECKDVSPDSTRDGPPMSARGHLEDMRYRESGVSLLSRVYLYINFWKWLVNDRSCY